MLEPRRAPVAHVTSASFFVKAVALPRGYVWSHGLRWTPRSGCRLLNALAQLVDHAISRECCTFLPGNEIAGMVGGKVNAAVGCLQRSLHLFVVQREADPGTEAVKPAPGCAGYGIIVAGSVSGSISQACPAG